jgi:hypothetical protein
VIAPSVYSTSGCRSVRRWIAGNLGLYVSLQLRSIAIQVGDIMWNMGKSQVFPAGCAPPHRPRDAGVRMNSFIVNVEPY